MSPPQNAVTNALAEPGGDLGISEVDLGTVDLGGKVKIEGRDPVIVSRHRPGKSREAQR
jgi:hypothetical protein